jgi:aminoglycoside 3-N-acetyltransferase
MTSITQSEIEAGLRALGLTSGDRVLVHSSLSSLGYVEGGADAVIDALRAAVGPTGTVLVPTLTGSEALSPVNPPHFDPDRTPCWTGHIPEIFRQRPAAVRSWHPTHSAAAIGPDAYYLTRDHLDSLTPCDALSPYGKLAQMENGYVLLLGVDHESNTTLHHVEELAGVPYHMQPGFALAHVTVKGEVYIRHIMLHAYGTPRDFNIIEPILRERGIQRTGQIGQATVRLVHAGRLVATVLPMLRANPRSLCAIS